VGGDQFAADVWHFGVYAQDVGEVGLVREAVGHGVVRRGAQLGSGPVGGVGVGVPGADDLVMFGPGVPVQR
jgi:hypothetical protein